MVKMCLSTKNQDPCSNSSKPVTLTDTRTRKHKQTNTQKDLTEVITYRHRRMVIRM